MRKFIFKDIVICETNNELEAEGLLIDGFIPVNWHFKEKILFDELELVGSDLPITIFETKLGLLSDKPKCFVVNDCWNIVNAYSILAISGFIENTTTSYMMALILSGYEYKINPVKLKETPMNIIKAWKHNSETISLENSLWQLKRLLADNENELMLY